MTIKSPSFWIVIFLISVSFYSISFYLSVSAATSSGKCHVRPAKSSGTHGPTSPYGPTVSSPCGLPDTDGTNNYVPRGLDATRHIWRPVNFSSFRSQTTPLWPSAGGYTSIRQDQQHQSKGNWKRSACKTHCNINWLPLYLSKEIYLRNNHLINFWLVSFASITENCVGPQIDLMWVDSLQTLKVDPKIES